VKTNPPSCPLDFLKKNKNGRKEGCAKILMIRIGSIFQNQKIET
jgi:hypothetical protein